MKHSIKSYSVYSAKAKLEKPIADATHTLTEISFIVLRLQLESGVVGESYLLSFQYSPAAIAGALKDVGEQVRGEQVYDTVKVFEKINAANEYFGLEGPNYSCLTACAAGTQAVGEALEMIRRGDADLMLTGGAHSMLHPLGVTGFNLLTALSTRNDAPQKASRPFDRLRDGFVVGEGAGVVILEELEHARRRGAMIYAELTGYGCTADAFRVTDCHPEGRGAIGCMQMAIADAGLAPQDIHYVNAHGTSTSVNDRVESLACKQVFGEHASKVPVSSTKSMMGHLIAAAGATELIICLKAIENNALPPTINYDTPDPECDLDYVPNVAREARCDYALSNSFGFGGQNIALIVGRYTGD